MPTATSSAARIFLCAMSLCGAACSRPEGATPPAGRAGAEIARIQKHLARAEAAMRAADVSHLTDEQRAARRTHLARLGRYREAGHFPHNHVDGIRRPIFVDGHGTRCAMAHLIEAGGGGELVARVARERNGAYVRELAGDPELVGWLDRNGISLAEAAAIQPQYEGDPAPFQPWLALASLGATAADVAAIVVNRNSDAGTGAGWFGVVAGVGSVVIGVAPLHRSQQSSMVILSAVNIGMGVTAGLFGLRNLVDERAEPRTSPPGRRVSLAPAVGPLNGVVLQGEF